MFCLEHCTAWFSDRDTIEIGLEVFGELRNVLKEYGGDKMVRETNQ